MILYILAALGALAIGVTLLVLGFILLVAKWAGWEDDTTEEDWDGL